METTTQSETTQNWQKSFLENPMMFWKNWNKLVKKNVFNGNAPAWLKLAGLSLDDQSADIKSPFQQMTKYLAFNVKQQKIFLDYSNRWMNFLVAMAKNHRENCTDQTQCLNADYSASKEMLKSFIALMDQQMENFSTVKKQSEEKPSRK